MFITASNRSPNPRPPPQGISVRYFTRGKLDVGEVLTIGQFTQSLSISTSPKPSSAEELFRIFFERDIWEEAMKETLGCPSGLNGLSRATETPHQQELNSPLLLFLTRHAKSEKLPSPQNSTRRASEIENHQLFHKFCLEGRRIPIQNIASSSPMHINRPHRSVLRDPGIP